MPEIQFDGHTVECASGAILRDALLSAGLTPHNDRAETVNCGGKGACGTCAVVVADEDAVGERTRRERLQLSTPPHAGVEDLRLACQCRVLEDVAVRKGDGLWGQEPEATPSG